MKFYTEILLPESGVTCKVNQLTLSDYITINRFIQNGNNEHITDCFEQIISEYTDYNGRASLIDGIIILLFLRSISIGVSVTGKKNNCKIEISFMPLLEKLQALEFNNNEIKVDKLSILLKTPFCFTDIDYEKFISDVKVSRIRAKSLTPLQQRQIFNILPAYTINKIHSFVESIDEQLKVIETEIAGQKIEIQLLNNSLFEYVKFFYTENILNIQQKIIKIVQVTQVDTAYLLSLPPAEINILFQTIAEEKKRQSKKDNLSNLSIPGIQGIGI